MTEVLFYHLERSPLDAVLPGLLEKSLERGWRALVTAGSEEAAQAIDTHLWTYQDGSFLPHGRTDHDDQAILIATPNDDRPAGYDILFVVKGAELPIETVSTYTRCVLLFSADEAETARGQWKAVKADSSLEATYWKQSPQGRWEKAA